MGGVGQMLCGLADHYTNQSEIVKNWVRYMYIFWDPAKNTSPHYKLTKVFISLFSKRKV